MFPVFLTMRVELTLCWFVHKLLIITNVTLWVVYVGGLAPLLTTNPALS